MVIFLPDPGGDVVDRNQQGKNVMVVMIDRCQNTQHIAAYRKKGLYDSAHTDPYPLQY